MNNRIVRMLISLGAAFVIWLTVVTIISPESVQTYYDVPVTFEDKSLKSRNLMVISSTDVTMDLELSGNRTDLNKLSRDNITILADLSGITSAGEHTVYYSISYPGSISSTISVLNQEQQLMTVVVAEYTEKHVPLVVEYAGTVPNGYIADKQNPVLSRDTITLTGQKSVIDRISQAVITVDLSNRTADFTQICELEFRDAENHAVTNTSHVSSSVSEVTATVKVDMIKTVDVVVQMIPGGGMTANDVTYSVDLEQIVVSGPSSILEDLEQIVLTIDLATLTEDRVYTFNIDLPAGATNVTGITQVHVSVTMPAVTTKIFEISKEQFEIINVPEGMTVEIKTQRIAVIIQGREYRLKEIQLDNIRVIIDFADAVEGDGRYTVNILIVGIEDVGVVSSHEVVAGVTLIDPPEPEE